MERNIRIYRPTAEELHAEAILIDEAAGRAVALQRGLQPICVLGTLLRAKERGLFREISPLLDRLQTERLKTWGKRISGKGMQCGECFSGGI